MPAGDRYSRGLGGANYPGREPGLAPPGLVAMDDALGGSLVEPLLSETDELIGGFARLSSSGDGLLAGPQF